jgi:hypothetical protein
MATYEISNTSNLGDWSYIQLKLLTPSCTEKIGTWTNNTGSSVIITSITIRCGTGNGYFTQGSDLTGNGSTFNLKLKVGSVETESKAISNKVSVYNTGIDPTDLRDVTFTLNSPVTVSKNSSVTIYPKYVSTPGNNVVLCAGASKWGCSTNLNNTAHSWPKINTSGGVWVRVNGVWKQGIPWVRVNGVWKQGIAYVRAGGTWKTL